MSEPIERIVRLEERLSSQHDEILRLERVMNNHMAAMQVDLDEIKEAMSRQRGFWAGVTFFASVIVFALSQLWHFISTKG